MAGIFITPLGGLTVTSSGFIVHLGRFMTEPGFIFRKSNQVEIDFNLVEKSTEVWFHQTPVGQFNT